jgi:cholesterol transport system auxiliary component
MQLLWWERASRLWRLEHSCGHANDRRQLGRAAACAPLLALALLAGCSGLFESEMPAPQAYMLRLPTPQAGASNASAPLGVIQLLRPEADPGLASERIALLRNDRRFDYYAASRWAGPLPDVLAALAAESLRGSQAFAAVLDDGAPFAPEYTLRIAIRRFEADYTAGGAPRAIVVLDCSLGRFRDRSLLGNFIAKGSATASADRLAAVVQAFESATSAALAEMQSTAVETLRTRQTQKVDKPVASISR